MRRRDLVETDTESGTISHADPQTVYNRLSGTITWLPRVGQVIRPGQSLFRIGGEPVILISGSTPAYRDLDASDSPGPDIEQLNRDLVRLGFDRDGIVIDDEWQLATTTGVELFQESMGEAETGELSLGRVVFLPGAQVVSALDGTVGSTSGGSGGATGSASASDDASVRAGGAKFVRLAYSAIAQPGTTPGPGSAAIAHSGSCSIAGDGSTPTAAGASCPTSSHPPLPSKHGLPSQPHGSGSADELSKLTELLKAEAEQLKAATAALRSAARSAGRHSSSSSASGSASSKSTDTQSAGATATAILQTSSTQLIVTVDLSASSQSEAKVGRPVTVELPSGQTVAAKITAVSSVAQSPASSTSGTSAAGASGGGASAGSSSTVPVTIKLKRHHHTAGLDQASVSVRFAQTEARHVLSVSVTALIATPGGNFAVQKAAAPARLIPVTTGMFAAGYVQISGSGIHPGLVVTDSQG